MSDWRAVWTGGYPCLCVGEWQLFKDGRRVHEVPYGMEPAYTEGTYQRWQFDEDWLEVFEDYEDGMSESEWIGENRLWLSDIADEEDFPKIFRAFQESDWRYMSCGGCI